jgi:hypothetical protein
VNKIINLWITQNVWDFLSGTKLDGLVRMEYANVVIWLRMAHNRARILM